MHFYFWPKTTPKWRKTQSEAYLVMRQWAQVSRSCSDRPKNNFLEKKLKILNCLKYSTSCDSSMMGPQIAGCRRNGTNLTKECADEVQKRMRRRFRIKVLYWTFSIIVRSFFAINYKKTIKKTIIVKNKIVKLIGLI